AVVACTAHHHFCGCWEVSWVAFQPAAPPAAPGCARSACIGCIGLMTCCGWGICCCYRRSLPLTHPAQLYFKPKVKLTHVTTTVKHADYLRSKLSLRPLSAPVHVLAG